METARTRSPIESQLHLMYKPKHKEMQCLTVMKKKTTRVACYCSFYSSSHLNASWEVSAPVPTAAELIKEVHFLCIWAAWLIDVQDQSLNQAEKHLGS